LMETEEEETITDCVTSMPNDRSDQSLL